MEPFITIKIVLYNTGQVGVERSGEDNELGVLGLLEKSKDIIKADYAKKQTLIQPVTKIVR